MSILLPYTSSDSVLFLWAQSTSPVSWYEGNEWKWILQSKHRVGRKSLPPPEGQEVVTIIDVKAIWFVIHMITPIEVHNIRISG